MNIPKQLGTMEHGGPLLLHKDAVTQGFAVVGKRVDFRRLRKAPHCIAVENGGGRP